jgi:mRNA interferase RelE/StbE
VARYKVLIKPSAVKEIEAIRIKEDRRRIVNRILELGMNPRPHGSQKLSGQDKYRLREGRYRILYAIQEQELVVNVVKVGHRKDAYR